MDPTPNTESPPPGVQRPPRSVRKKVLAVSSSGGHWVQLRRIRPAFEGCDVTFVTTKKGYRSEVKQHKFRTIPDSNSWQKLQLIRTALAALWIVLSERPDVIISTGAAPGFFCVRFGRLVGAKTIWVDSIANVEELSSSGKQASKFVDLCLTQWPDLAKANGLTYAGNVLGRSRSRVTNAVG